MRKGERMVGENTLRADLRPSMQWYPGDWRAAPELKLCKMSSQGVWMHMLCLMFESPERGCLLMANGWQMDNRSLARIIGATKQAVDTAIADLEEHNVFSRLGNGAIYCRRMRRKWLREKKEQEQEQATHAAKVRAGQAGAAKRWKQDDSTTIADPDSRTWQKTPPSTSSSTPTSSSKDPERDIYTSKDQQIHFEQIWTDYPDKSGKKQSLRHFQASVKNEKDWADIQTALTNYKQSQRVADGFVQNGSTWFNNWRDWVTPTPHMMGTLETAEDREAREHEQKRREWLEEEDG